MNSGFILKTILLATVFLLSALPAFAVTINVDDTCTLHQAINAANETTGTDKGGCETGSGKDTIVMPPRSGNSVISVTEDYPRFTSEIVIDGNNNLFDGGGNTHFFETWNNANVTLKRMQLRNGSGEFAGAIHHRKGSLTLENVRIRNSVSSGTTGAGAITSSSRLTIKDSYLENNSGIREGADRASAIAHDGGNFTMSGSSFWSNIGDFAAIDIASAGSTVRITNSSFIQNTQGGGVAIRITPISGLTSRLTHLTITGGVIFGKGNHHLRNSILYGSDDDCAGTLATNENNIIGNNNCGGSPSNDDPLLGQINPYLASPYLPLKAGSPAIDAAGDCTSLTTVDQAGTVRPQPTGGDCDIGAYELPQTAPPPTAVPTEAPTDEPPTDDPPTDDPPGDDTTTDDPPGDDTTNNQPTNNQPTNNQPGNNPPGDGGGSSGSGSSSSSAGGSSSSSDGDSASDDQGPAAVIIPTCLSLPDHISVRNITHLTQCQQVDAAGIGNAAVLGLGFRDGVDVWGWVLHNTQVCFEGSSGSFRFLDAATAPRAVSELPAFLGANGMICATIDPRWHSRPGRRAARAHSHPCAATCL